MKNSLREVQQRRFSSQWCLFFFFFLIFHLVVKDAIGVIILSDSLSAKIERRDSITLGPDFMFDSLREKIEDGFELDSAGKKSVTFLIRFESSTNEIIYIPGVGMITTKPYGGDIPVEYLLSQEEILKRHYIISNQIQLLHNGSIHEYASTLLLPAYGDHVHKARICAYYPENYDIFDAYFTQMLLYYHNPALGPEGSPYEGYAEILDRLIPPDCSDTFSYLPNPAKCVSKAKKEYYYGESLIEAEGNTPKSSFFFYPTCINNISSSLNQFSKPVSKFIMEKSACQRIRLFGHFYSESDLKPDALNPEEILENVFGAGHKVDITINGESVSHADVQSIGLYNILLQYRAVYNHPELDIEAIGSTDAGLVDTLSFLQYFSNGLFNKEFDPLSPKDYLEYTTLPHRISTAHNLQNSKKLETKSIHSKGGEHHMTNSNVTLYETIYKVYSLYYQLISRALYTNSIFVKTTEDELKRLLRELQKLVYHIPMNTESIFVGRNQELKTSSEDREIHSYNNLNTLLSQAAAEEALSFGSIQCIPIDNGKSVWSGTLNLTTNKITSGDRNNKKVCILEGPEQAERFGRRVLPGPHVAAISTSFYPFFGKSVFDIPEAVAIESTGDPALFACLDGYIPARDVIHTENLFYCKEKDGSYQIEGHIEFHCVPDLPTCTLEEFLFDVTSTNLSEDQQNSLDNIFVDRIYYEGEYLETVAIDSIWNGYNARKSRFLKLPNEEHYYIIPPQCRRQVSPENKGITTVKWFYNHSFEENASKEIKTLHSYAFHKTIESLLNILMQSKDHFLTDIASMSNDSITALFNDATIDTLKNPDITNIRYGYCPVKVTCNGGIGYTTLLQTKCNQEMSSLAIEGCALPTSSELISSLQCGSLILDSTDSVRMVSETGDTISLLFEVTSKSRGICPDKMVMNPILFPFSPSTSSKEIKYQMVCRKNSYRWAIVAEDTSFTGGTKKIYNFIRPSSTPLCVDEQYSFQSKVLPSSTPPLPDDHSLITKQSTDIGDTLTKLKDNITYYDTTRIKQFHPTLVGTIGDVMDYLTKKSLAFTIGNPTFMRYNSWFTLKIMKNQIGRHPRTFKISPILTLSSNLQESDLDTFVRDVDKDPKFSQLQHKRKAQQGDMNALQYYVGPYSQNLNMEKGGIIMSDGFRFANGIYVNTAEFLQFYPSESYDIIENKYHFDISQLQIRYAKAYCSVETLYPHHIPLEERLKWTDIRYTYDTEIFTTELPSHGLPIGGFMTIQPKKFVYMTDVESDSNLNMYNYRLHSEGVDLLGTKISFVCLPNGMLNVPYTRIPYVKRYSNMEVDDVGISNEYKLPPTIPPISDNISVKDFNLQNTIDGCFTTNGAMIIHQDSHYHKIPIRNTYYRSLQTAQSLEQKVQNPLLHIYCRPFLPLTTYVDSTMRLLSPHGITFPLSTIHCIYPSFDQIEGGHNSFSIDPLDTHTITKDTFVLGASSKYGNIVPAIATSFSYNRAIHGDGAMLRCTSEGWSIVSSGFKRVISPIFLHNLIDSSSPYHTEYMKNISNRMRLEVHDRGLDGVKPESSFSNILHSKHSSMYLYDILTIIPRRSTVIPISSQNNLKIDILETKTIPPTQYILNQFNEYDITNAVPYSRNTILAPTFMFLPYDRHSDIEYITTIIIGLYTLKKAPSTRVNLEESKFISYDNISTLATAPDEDKLIVLAQALPSPADATQLEMYKDSGIPFTAKTTTITGVFMRLNVIYRENYANFGGSLNSHSHRHRIHQENNYPEGKTHLSPYPDQDKYPFTCSIGQLDRARLGSLRRKEAENLDKYDYFTQFSPGYVSQSDSSFVAAILIGAEETEYRTSQRIRTSINIPSTPAITSYFQNSVHFPTCSIKNGFIQREDYEVKERGKYSRYICSMFFPNLTTDTDVTIIADWYTLNPLVMQDTQSITRPHQSSSDTMCYQTYDKVELNLLPGSGTTDERSDQIGGVYDPTMILRKLPRIFLQHATVNDNSTENKDTMILSYIPVTSKKGAAEGAIVKKLDIYFHTSSSYNYQPSPETPRSTRSSLSLIYSRNPKTLKFKYFLYDEYTGLSGLLLDIPDDNDNSAKLVVDIESMQITPVCFSHITHHYSLSATYSRSTAYLLDTKSYNTNPPTMNQFIDDNTIRCNDDYLLQYSSGMKCDAKSKSIKTICFHAGFVDIESNVSGEETLEKNLNVIYTSNSLPISQSQTSSLKKYSPPIFRFYNAKTYHYIKTDLARMDKDGLERPRYIHPEVDQKTIRYIIHRPTPGSYIAIVQQLFYHYVNGVCNTDNIQTPPFTIPDITVKQLEFELMQHVNEELDTDIFTVKDRVILRRTMNKICHDLTDTLYPRVDGISPILPQDEKPNQCDMSTIVNVLLMYSAETVGHLTQKAEHCVFLLENRDFITISPDLESLFYMISYSHPTSHILLDEYMYRFYPSNHKVHPDDKDIVLLPHSTLHLNFNLPLQQISSSLPTLIEPIASITSLQTDLSKYQKRSIPPFGDIYDDFIYYFGDPGICDAILPDPMITSFSNFQIDSVERGNNARNNVKENKEMELYNIDNMTDVGNGRKGKIVDLNLNTSKYPLNWCLPIPKGTIVPFHFLFDQTHIDAYLFKYVSHPQLKAVNKYYNTPSAAFPNSNKAFGELSVKIQDRDDYDINSSIYELDSIIYDKDKYILTVNVKVNDSEYFTKSPYAIYFEERFETGNTIPPPKLHPHLWVTDVGTTFASLPAIKTYLKPLLSTKSLRHIDQYTETYESLLSYIPQKPYNFCVTCDYNENIPDNHEYTLLYLYSSLSFHSLTPQSVTNVNQSSNTFERESIRQLSSMQYDTKFATPQELSIEIMIVEQGINSTATHSSAKSLIELVQANVFSLDDGSIVCDDEHDTPLLLQDLENKTCNLRVRITSDMIQRLSNLYISEDHYLLYLLVQLWTAESKLTQVLLLPYQPTSYGLQSVTASVYDPLVIEEIIKSTPKPMITSSTPYIIKTNPLVSDISTNQPFSYLGIHTEYKKNINDDLGLGPGFDGGSAESDNPGKSQVFVISDRSTMKISIRGISSDKTAKPKIQLQFEDKYKKMMDQNSVLESLFVWKEGLTLSATSTSSTPSQYQPLSTPIDCKYTRTTEKIDIFHHQCDILITAVDQNSNNILPYDDILEGTLLARIEFVKGNNIEYTNWELITIVILPPPKPTLQFLDLGFSRLHEMDEEEYLKQILLPTVNHQHNSEDNLLRNPEWNQLRMNLQITDTTTTQKLQAYTSDYILITAGKPLFIADENVEEGTNSIVTHSVSTLYISDEPVPISSATTTTLFEVTPTGHRSITALGLSKPLTNLFFTKQTLSHVVGVDVVEVNGEDKNIVKYIPNTFLLHLHPCKRVILYIHVMTKSGSMAVSQYIFDPSALKTEMFSNLDVGVVESILNLRKDFCQHDQLAQDYIDTPSAVLTNDVSIRALLLHSLDSINMVSMMYNLSYQRYPFLSSQLQEPTTALQKTELQLYESNLFLILQSVISSMQQIDLVRDYIIAKYGSIGIAILEPTNSYILLRLRECVVGINTLVTTLQEKNFEHTIARFEQYQQDEMIRLSLEYQQAMQNLQSVFIYKNTEQNMAIYSSRTSTFISTVRLWVAGYYETLRSKQRTESIQLLTTSLKTVTDALTVNDDIPMNIIERSIHVIDSAAGIVETIAQDLENKKDQTTQDEDTLDDIVVETRSLLQSTEIMMNSMSPILFYIAPTQDKDSTSTDNDDDTNDGTADDDNDNTPIPQDGIIKTLPNTRYNSKQIDTSNFVTTFAYVPKRSASIEGNSNLQSRHGEHMNFSFSIKSQGFMRKKHQNMLSPLTNFNNDDNQQTQSDLAIQIPFTILDDVTRTEPAIISYSVFKSKQLSKYAIDGKQTEESEQKNPLIQDSALNFTTTTTNNDYSSITPLKPSVSNIVNLSLLSGITGSIIPSSPPSITPTSNSLWYFIEVPISVPSNHEINPASSCVYIQSMKELIDNSQTETSSFKDDNSCQLHLTTATSIICRCTHLTYFSSRFSTQAFVPRFQRISITDIRSISWDNLTRNPTPIIILIVWPILTIIFVFIGSRVDRRLYRQGFVKLLQDWDPATQKPYTKIDVYKITKPTSILNHLWRRYLYTIRDSHLWLSVFYRQTTHNYSSQSRALAVMIVLLSSFTLSGLLFGYTSQGFIIVIVITSVCIAAINEIFRFLYDRTDQDKLKRYVYYYAESLLHFYFTGKSNLFPKEMHEKLMQDRPAIFSDSKSAQLEEIVLSLGWEAIPIWHIVDHKNRDVPKKYEGTIFDKNLVKKYASTAANVDNFYYRPRDYETKIDATEARRLHSIVRHKLPKECLDIELIHKFFFNRSTSELIPSNSRILVVVFMIIWTAACYFLVLTNATVLATSGATSATLSLTRDWVTSAGTSLLLNIFVISFVFGLIKNMIFYFGKLLMLKCVSKYFKGRSSNNSTNINNSAANTDEITNYKYQQSSPTSKKLVDIANNTTESLYTQAMPSICTFRRFSFVSEINDVEMADLKQSLKLKDMKDCDSMPQQPLDARVIDARNNDHSNDGDDDDDRRDDDSIGDNNVFSVQQHKTSPEELYQYIKNGSVLPSTKTSDVAHVFFADDNTSNTSTN